MRMIKKLLVILFFLLSTSLAQAEYGLGYSADDFDPQTHEFHRIYRDWQEGVVPDPRTGDYIITYKDDGIYSQTSFEPGTKITPTFTSMWRKADGDFIAYSYRLKNGRESAQNIDSVMLFVTDASSLDAPRDWEGFVVPTFTDARLRLSWMYRGQVHRGGLEPGNDVVGLRVLSHDLPGVAMAQIKGATRATVWLGEMPPGAVRKRADQLLASDFVPRYAVAPTIAVPTPFAVAPVLSNLQRHVDKDLVAMKLIDPALAARLDPLFAAAMAAAEGGNNVALRNNLRSLRRALRDGSDRDGLSDNRQGDDAIEDAGEKIEIDRDRRIARIARHVLEFDLKYVERRVRPKEGRPDLER
jgi:hypothetical protein